MYAVIYGHRISCTSLQVVQLLMEMARCPERGPAGEEHGNKQVNERKAAGKL